MKGKRALRTLLIMTTVLLIALVTSTFLRDDDSYTYYTGMGNTFVLTPDDENLLFPYYLDGDEAIFEAGLGGGKIRQLTKPAEGVRHHTPKLSVDGEKLLYLEQMDEVNHVVVAGRDGKDAVQVTSDDFHVAEAIFSQDGTSVYFAATPAKEFLKGEEGLGVGYDLYRVDAEGGADPERLTTRNDFIVGSLTLSSAGNALFFTVDSELFSLNVSTLSAAPFSYGKVPKESYSHVLSPDETALLYTKVAEESEDSSLFEYELFLADLKNGKQTRLTDLNASVVSPRFFHRAKDQVAFLLNDNWPDQPETHKLYIQDVTTKELTEISLDVPQASTWQKLKSSLMGLINGTTLAVLYTLIGLMATTYVWLDRPDKPFKPAIISFALSIAVFVSSFIAAFIYDPWAGIAIGMVAAAMVVASIVIALYALILRFIKRNRT